MNREEFVSQFICGDLICLKGWEKSCYIAILDIGKNKFFYENEKGVEGIWTFDLDWIRYVHPKPKVEFDELVGKRIKHKKTGATGLITNGLTEYESSLEKERNLSKEDLLNEYWVPEVNCES